MNVKEKRRAKGLSQLQLANQMGVSRATVAMWETQGTLPRTDKLPALAKALDCTADDLLNDGKESDENG